MDGLYVMRRFALASIILSLVFSLAAPTGAAFALEQEESTDTVLVPVVEESDAIAEETESTQPVLFTDPGDSIDDPVPPVIIPDDSQPPMPPVLPEVVIAQIQVGAQGDASDEYVSIYNNSDVVVDVTGWCLRGKSKIFACLNAANVDYVIAPGAYIGFSRMPDRPGEHGLVVPLLSGSNHIVASNDTIQLVRGEEIIDVVSWMSQPSSTMYAVERNWDMQRPGRLQTGNDAWSWKKTLAIYGRILALIECGEGVMVLENEACPEPETVNTCSTLVISEIAANVDEQFIELQNTAVEQVSIAGCQVQTNRSTKSFVFPEPAVAEAGAFIVVPIIESELTLTKTTSGTVYILSSDGRTEADSVGYSNLPKNTSWASVEGGWVQTYALTPGAENSYLQYPPCEPGYTRNLETGRCNRIAEEAVLADCGEGRERNPDTGRCRNIVAASTLTPCKEGQYRSEETNRCRSIATAAASVLKPCDDGQFRNPETNRCKKIASAEDVALADCGEGRERNPETNRCRNAVVAGAMTDTLPFAVEKTASSTEQFVGWWTLGIVAVIGAGYGAWEWREELGQVSMKVRQFVRRSK